MRLAAEFNFHDGSPGRRGSGEEPGQVDALKRISVRPRWCQKDLKGAQPTLVSASSGWIIQYV